MTAASMIGVHARDDEVRAFVVAALARQRHQPGDLAAIERQPYIYQSTCGLEELTVRWADGSALSLILKDLDWRGTDAQQPEAKPAFVHDPEREIAVYEQVLGPSGMSTPTCYGAIAEPAQRQYWLLLEKVAGVELYQVGTFAVWEEVARWLARFHATFATRAGLPLLARQAHLLRYDLDWYRRWGQRLRAGLGRRGQSPASTEHLEQLADRYERAVPELAALPVTLLHGEFYSSNILVGEDAGGVRVCPIDWEMAAFGPGLVDLAALTAGAWSAAKQQALARAYYEALPPDCRLTPNEFARALDLCRFAIAVQWVGWSADWSPPAAHAHDWLGEAVRLANALAL